MPRKFYKFHLVFDEGLSPPRDFPILNNRYSVLHIAIDLKKKGAKDYEIYKTAVKLNRLIVTLNYKDFKKFANNSKQTGIISLSSKLSRDQIDKKLTAFLSKSKRGDLYGQTTYISGESKK